jgi:phosphorylase kinase alpha/beta subunit
MSTQELLSKLHEHDRVISNIILARQDAVSGLFPASTEVNQHGDYRDAWVRDNAYSMLAVWGLGLAYQHVGGCESRGWELRNAALRTMRALLYAMMRQAPRVAAFTARQDPRLALHAKYNASTGLPVVGDLAWGHLQLDATSLFVLYVAHFSASGLHVCQSLHDVHFVQNLGMLCLSCSASHALPLMPCLSCSASHALPLML